MVANQTQMPIAICINNFCRVYTLILCDSYAEVTCKEGGGGVLSAGMHCCCPVAPFTPKNATVTLTASLMGLAGVCLVPGGTFLLEKNVIAAVGGTHCSPTSPFV